MHIVTGMLLAGLLGRQRGVSILPMLRTGPVQTVHSLPGRVRFRVESLVGDTARAASLRSRLGTLDAVVRADVSPVTGSVLIEYNEDLVRPELLFAAIVRLLGLEKELEHTPRPKVVKELQGAFDSLNRVVYDQTAGVLDFSSALLILMATVGVGKIMREGAASIPSGFALLWWGAHQLLGHGRESTRGEQTEVSRDDLA